MFVREHGVIGSVFAWRVFFDRIVMPVAVFPRFVVMRGGFGVKLLGRLVVVRRR